MPSATPRASHQHNTDLLPPEVSLRSGWFSRARSYPIFSHRWWQYRSRSLVAGWCVAYLIVGALIAAPLVFRPSIQVHWVNAAYVMAVFLLPLLMLCLTGPGLTVLVRRRALIRFETAALLAAILLGMALSAAFFGYLVTRYEALPDVWINAQAEDGLTSAHKPAYKPADEERPVERALTARPPAPGMIGILSVSIITCCVFLLVCWLGGLIDLSTYLRQRGRLDDVLQRKELERARAARNAAEMRLSVLAAQVEPHFLFNTLASVRSAIDTDPRRAAHIVDHMVAFLRSSIPQMRDEAGNASVALATQLHMARCYLALMHERMPRLHFSVEAEAGLHAALVPPLMLISLVENAVKHGVEPKIGPAHIGVAARCAGSDDEPVLEITVTDDGVGFGDAASGDGIGLANIQERLRSYFGQHASLTLKALPGGGVAAILRVPLCFDH